MKNKCKVCGVELTDNDPKIEYYSKKKMENTFYFEGYCHKHYLEDTTMRYWRKKGLGAINKEIERIEYRKSVLLKAIESINSRKNEN